MKRPLGLIVVLVVLCAISSPARSEPFSFRRCLSFLGLCDVRQEMKCWCPDDYCPKKQPCPSPPASGSCDDYRPKPPPCPPGAAPRGCADDYDRKCCPIWLGGPRGCATSH